MGQRSSADHLSMPMFQISRIAALFTHDDTPLQRMLRRLSTYRPIYLSVPVQVLVRWRKRMKGSAS